MKKISRRNISLFDQIKIKEIFHNKVWKEIFSEIKQFVEIEKNNKEIYFIKNIFNVESQKLRKLSKERNSFL